MIEDLTLARDVAELAASQFQGYRLPLPAISGDVKVLPVSSLPALCWDEIQALSRLDNVRTFCVRTPDEPYAYRPGLYYARVLGHPYSCRVRVAEINLQPAGR